LHAASTWSTPPPGGEGVTHVTGFEEWYLHTHPRLVTSLVVFAGDVDVGRDAADETAVRALERWSRVRAMESPDGWAFRTGCNIVKRRARRAQLERRLLRRTAPASPVEGPTGELWALVAELPPRQRTAVVLRHVGQLSEPEIAEVMRVTRGTVSSTLRSAHRKLRHEIDEPVPDAPDTGAAVAAPEEVDHG
jgi:RNA polymerase sigma-70 factor, ECF subfamily